MFSRINVADSRARSSAVSGSFRELFIELINKFSSPLPHLAIANPNPFVTGQLLQTHRSARPNFIGADADFCAHTELSAVGKPRRGIPINRGRIDFIQKFFRMGIIASDDAVGMSRTIMVDMID